MNGRVARKSASNEANPVRMFENIPRSDGRSKTYIAKIFPMSPNTDIDVSRTPSVTYSNISSRTESPFSSL